MTDWVMVFPLVAFAIGVVIMVLLIGLAWAGWFFGGGESTPVGYYWLLLAGLALCVLSIIRWGFRSESDRHRKKWMAFILAAILLITLGAWWIISLGLFIAAIGLALLIYSSIRLKATYE